MKHLVVLFVVLLFAVPVYGADVYFTWTPPTCDDLAGYTIYWGDTAGGPYTQSCSTADANVTSATCSINAVDVTLYFILESIDDDGNKSLSNEVAIPFPDDQACEPVTDFTGGLIE